MPLSTSTSRRALKHTRAIQVEAFARDDGLWDIDARISDTKTSANSFASEILRAGVPVHEFREADNQRPSGIHGCTNLTELARMLPTAAIQALAGEVPDTADCPTSVRQSDKPFQLDRGHALHSDGMVVTQYYPRWAVKSQAVPESS